MTGVLTGASVIREDGWLTSVMGLPVFRVDVEALKAPADFVASTSSALYYAKVPTDRIDSVRTLEQVGFSVIETAVTFVWDPSAARRAGESAVPVNDCAEADAPAVLEIAGSCFRYSRFHMDPRVPIDTAHRVKREWIRSYTEGTRGNALIVASVDGRPAGFLAVLEPAAGTIAIDLVGVANWAQRRGVGRSLVAAFVDRYRGAAARLQVGTQIINLPSIAMYQQMGFVLASSQYVLHRHVA